MCGIAGIFHFNHSGSIEENVLTRMRDMMKHRGPDGGANWIARNREIGLAHRRLSIIDLSSAATQPMSNEDGTIWVTFNGEIYNHVSLRAKLVAAGHQFKTDHSDTEVLVHGFEEWGIEGLLSRLTGDYAVALYDGPSETLYLFRDRIGVKPLYFCPRNGVIIFASEIKAILQYPGVRRDVDPIAMYHYLSFLTSPAPLTMFAGIYKLPAGFCLKVSKGSELEARRYWDALPGQGTPPKLLDGLSWEAREKYYVEGIQNRLSASVQRRMMSDVPFGVFLSGGVDSSTNVALMSQFMNRPVDTFTVGFKDHRHLNELDEARLVADRFKTNHHEVLIDEADMRGYLDQLIFHQDEPIADWVCIPLHFVSKLAKENGVTVVQVGEGSDEQFCGYASYMGYLDLYKKYWVPFRRFLPLSVQKSIAGFAGLAAQIRPSLAVYADIVDRASRGREHFWSGATSFTESLKARLVAPENIHAATYPPELVGSGLFPKSYSDPDSFNVIRSFNERIDRTSPAPDVLARMIYNEFKLRLPELLLMRVDKIAMSSSVEARVPFLDHDLVQFTMDIPMEFKVHGGEPKYLLKKAVKGLIPDEIIYRKKMGFAAPMSQWMRGDFGRQVRSSLMSSRLHERGFFDRSYIERLCRDHESGRQDNSLHLWTLYNLTSWYDYWIDGPAVASA